MEKYSHLWRNHFSYRKISKRRQRSHLFPSLPSLPLPTPFPVDNSSLPLLSVGDPVLLQHPTTLRWSDKGVIDRVNSSGLSYMVRRGDDTVVSRGRRLLRLDKSSHPNPTSQSADNPVNNTPPERGHSVLSITDTPTTQPTPRRSRRRRKITSFYQAGQV